MTLINFLSLEDVLEIHQMQLDSFGGSPGLRDKSGLASAVDQPQSTWEGRYLYETIFDKAAVYAFHIAQAQAFVDGNKRTALHAALLFLHINGYPIKTHSDLLWKAMISLAEKSMDKEDLSILFRDLFIDSLKKP